MYNLSEEQKKEINSMFRLFGDDIEKLIHIYERQMDVLQSRAQILMSLAGVVLTITGFSGRRIAGTSFFAQFFVISGLAIVLLSAIWTWKKVLGIKWLTTDLEGENDEILARIIIKRDLKTRAYNTGGSILCTGFVVYSIAFAKMLIFSTI